VSAAEARLAGIEAQGELGPAGQFVKARLRFFQGEYAEALALLEEVPADPARDELESAVRAVAEETRGFVEVPMEGGHFRVRHEPGPDAVLVPMLADALPRIRERLGKRLGVVPDHTIVIEVYPTTASLARVTGLTEKNMEDSGTIAIAKWSRLMITTPRALVRGYRWKQTLAHEYLHLLITKRSRNRVPIWLHEGLSRYHEGFWDTDEAPRLRPAAESLVAAALKAGELISFEEMSPSMALLPTQRHTMLAFAEVQTAIAYLLERSGADAVARLLGALRDAAEPDLDAALKAVTGKTVAGFERDWRRWLKRRGYRVRKDVSPAFRRFKRSARPDDVEELDGLEKSIRDHILLGDLLRGRKRPKAGLAEYERAESRGGGRQRAFVRCRQASALLELDQPDAAIEAVRELPELQPGVMMSYVLLGKAHLRKGDNEEAVRWLRLALDHNPFDAMLHTSLLVACVALEDRRCVDRSKAALVALKLDPDALPAVAPMGQGGGGGDR